MAANSGNNAPRSAQEAVATVQTSPADNDRHQRYKSTLYGLGVTEIFLGIISCLLASATIAVVAMVGHNRDGTFTYSGQGLWGGAFLVATGVVGVRVRKHTTSYTYSANLSLSVITSLVMIALILLSGFAAFFTLFLPFAVMIIHCVLAFVGFCALLICIVHAVYCCKAACGDSPVSHGTVLYASAQPGSTQQFVKLANGHYMPVQIHAIVPNDQPTVPATQQQAGPTGTVQTRQVNSSGPTATSPTAPVDYSQEYTMAAEVPAQDPGLYNPTYEAYPPRYEEKRMQM